MGANNKTISEMWDAAADEYNSFENLDIGEVEKFADEQIDILRVCIAELEVERDGMRNCMNCSNDECCGYFDWVKWTIQDECHVGNGTWKHWKPGGKRY